MIGEWTNAIHCGDAFDVLPELPDESVHACVSDPPYGLAFMGRDWDDFEPKEYQEWCEEWAQEVKRVLKPGGHLLAFSGNRTHHRLFTGVEDAGFEVRDTLTWHYGSGFPKASDVSKTIDKRNGKGGEFTTDGTVAEGNDHLQQRRVENTGVNGSNYEPATDAAEEWDGWKTGLKPATEFVVMARKPFDGATVDCVLEHGTGALNIGECRIGMNGETKAEFDRVDIDQQDEQKYGTYEKDGTRYAGESTEGRYPANVVFGGRAADDLDEQVGELSRSGDTRTNGDVGDRGGSEGYGEGGFVSDMDADLVREYGDEGGPSRYFYTSKASRSERTLGGSIENEHPTVKPQDLMEWLVQLVTRDGQIVLDPFAGSGTTCKAAKELSREFVGIERQEKWADVARVRCNLNPEDPSIVRSDNQAGVEEF